MSAVYQSQQVVLSQYVRNAMLSALSARPAGPIGSANNLNLSHDPGLNPQPTTTLASLQSQVANFTGYAPATPTPVVPVNQGPNTQAMIASAVFEAVPGSPFAGDNVTGYWTDDGTNFGAAERFANNLVISISAPGDYIRIDLVFPINSPEQANPPV